MFNVYESIYKYFVDVSVIIHKYASQNKSYISLYPYPYTNIFKNCFLHDRAPRSTHRSGMSGDESAAAAAAELRRPATGLNKNSRGFCASVEFIATGEAVRRSAPPPPQWLSAVYRHLLIADINNIVL